MIDPEEQARANLYGLLARLFYAPPDQPLLEAIAGETLEGELGAAWDDLARAAAGADAEAVREEYEAAFVGTGKAPVTLYASAYAMRHSSEAPLAELRGVLAGLGLARRDEAAEPEDHVAALCDVMRHLVAEQHRDLAQQARFFMRWIQPVADRLCDAIQQSEKTGFYKAVARFAKSFFRVEQSAFEML